MNQTLRWGGRVLAKLLGAVVLLGAFCAPASALNIVFRDTTPGGMGPEALAGFNQAGQIWSSLLADPITVFLDIRYRNDGNTGVLGLSRPSLSVFSYADVRNAMVADATTAADLQAVSTLATGPIFGFRASNLDGTWRVDNDTNPCLPAPSAPCNGNNANLYVTAANGKALGFNPGTSATSPDGVININAYYGSQFDLNRSDGVAASRYDFVAVAANMIGHTLGFLSGVDRVDSCMPASSCGLDNIYGLERSAVYTPLDLFRFSTSSIRDLRVGVSTGFSLNRGQTFIESFSPGSLNGIGLQASNFSAGSQNLMQPSFAAGTLTNPSQADITAFDVIGWDAVNPIPEPETYAMMALGLVAVAAAARRRRRVEAGGF